MDVSEQQLVDCSTSNGNNGCNGGWMPNAYQYIISYGITTEQLYPYTQVQSSCRANGGSYKISSYQGGAMSNCSALSSLLAGRVLSVAVSAGSTEWMQYTGGILNTCGPAGSTINHGVTLVGAYQDNLVNYCTVKNSWGTSWGEGGYIRIDRSGTGNLCLICSYGYYPVI